MDAATWPACCPRCGIELTRVRQCMRHKGAKHNGEHCGNAAVQGAVVCHKHGARAPQVKAAAEQRVERAKAEKQVAALGLVVPVDIDPVDAVLREVALGAAYVDMLRRLVERDGEDGLTQWGVNGRTESAYWSMLTEQRKMLVNAAKACAALGIAERQVRMTEELGAQIGQFIAAVLPALGHDLHDPAVRAVVEPAMRQLSAVA